MKIHFHVIAVLALCTTVSAAAQAGDPVPPRRMISEAYVRASCLAHYLSIIEGAARAGRSYPDAAVISGMKRHLAEWRARLIDRGYEIVPSASADAGAEASRPVSDLL